MTKVEDPNEDCPSAAVVHRIHDRYLTEVVEALGLCPFARRSRELGRVYRPLVRTTDAPSKIRDVLEVIHTAIATQRDVEIVLVTFVDRHGHFASPLEFESFVARIRDAYSQSGREPFFMVAFHPRLGEWSLPSSRPPLTRDSLVSVIRRSPDPVIQCVRASVLERARAQAQRNAREKLLESVGGKDPQLRALIAQSVQTDSELSAEIARNNFAAVGAGEGRQELERVLEQIFQDRRQSYGF